MKGELRPDQGLSFREVRQGTFSRTEKTCVADSFEVYEERGGRVYLALRAKRSLGKWPIRYLEECESLDAAKARVTESGGEWIERDRAPVAF